MPIHFEPIGQDAMTEETTKVTKGFFPGAVGTAASGTLSTSSLAASQKKYYINLQHTSKDCFSVGYAHYAGSGSNTSADAMVGATEAQYGQLANMVLKPEEQEIGFTFTGSSTVLANRQDDVYFIVAERAQMLDRINKGNWTIQLSGSFATNVNVLDLHGSSSKVYLTDDSADVALEGTPGGPRYNIVSGALGTVASAYTQRHYGYLYPDLGIMVLNVTALTSSAGHGDGKTYVAGTNVCVTGAVKFRETGSNTNPGTDFRGNGLNPHLANTSTADGDNAWKLAISLMKGSVTMRSEEDQTTKSYFCRAQAGHFNFSMNPTFVSGSDKALRNQDMVGYPHTFITTVGLYQSAGNNPNSSQLVAVGRLSSPVQKNYGTEATIKVKLTY